MRVSQTTANWFMAVGYLLIAIVSIAVMGASMWGVGVIIRPYTDYAAGHWWGWLWLLVYPYLFIQWWLKSRRARRGEILPPLPRNTGIDHQSPGEHLRPIPRDLSH